MHFPIPDFRPQTPDIPAIVHVVAHSDVMWNRPVFKAPPLVIPSQPQDVRWWLDEVRGPSHPGRGH